MGFSFPLKVKQIYVGHNYTINTNVDTFYNLKLIYICITYVVSDLLVFNAALYPSTMSSTPFCIYIFKTKR